MRIVGGRLKGRALRGPATQDIRPTSDRLREAIFNILAHAYDDPIEGAHVIDLFAGTGAMGFEAISRGAKQALFVDDGSEARALLRANVEVLGLGGVTKIFRRDARKLGVAPAEGAFSLAFLDPPYGKGLAVPALAALRDGHWLTENALVIVEEATGAEVELPEGFTLLEGRTYGDTQVMILRSGRTPLLPLVGEGGPA
ncbi:MAG: 16S rRNA (guanine(966)-N(2))-methyltransferase RsmD [Beijerinckiaceae bacterium]|nr:MAG: 16S rRNA (guanine(966)-N(2))-methyltransferase RsmD [Beijerinckiaceae bacterium]